MKYKNMMAKALYDNAPESPEELAFRKGDILSVIEQNTGGLEGWWLCSLHGRQGIAPGNRLKLLIGPLFEAQANPTTPARAPSPSPSPAAAPGGPAAGYQLQGAGVYQVPPSPQQEVYQVPQRSGAALLATPDTTPNRVVTPTRVGQSYTYSPGQHNQQDLYDVPPCRAAQGVYDIPPAKTPGSLLYSGKHASVRPEGVYDVPPSQPDLRNQGIYDIPPSSSQAVYSVPPCRAAPALQEGTYDFPQPLKQPQEGIYDVPPPALTKPPPVSPESPYDFPPNSELPGARLHYPAANGNEGIYDVLPPTHHSDTAARCHGDLYDIPRGMQTLPPLRTPPAAAAPVAVPAFPVAGERCDRGRGVYDTLPAQDSPRAAVANDVTDGVNRLSFSSTGSTRSSMSTSSSSTGGSGTEGRLALDLDAAVQRLFRLQQAVEASVGAVQTLAASPHWRTFAFMERHANDVRAALDRVRAALGDFLVFGRGAAANATALSDPSLHSKLRRQLGRLEDSQQILLQTYQALEACGWAVGTLASPPSSRQQQHHHHHHHHHHAKSDELDRFVMVSRTVPDDVKQLASSVNGSAELLFRRSTGDGSLSRGGTPEESLSHPLPYPSPDNDNYGCQVKAFPVPSGQEKDNMNNSEKCVKSWMEDYDYVHLQGKEDFERQQKELLDKENIIKQSKVQLGQEQINQFKKLEQEVAKPVENDITQWVSHQHSSPLSDSSPSPSLPLTTTGGGGGGGGARVCAHDRQLLVFYAQQCEQHFVTLLNAVDAFFACVGAGQPPRIFVAHGKFVILSAHKLVFIGDTLSRQASAPDVANRVMNASNVLCDLLKTVVGSTKMAALNYPSTGAVQEMVDRVTELSHHAQQFKEQLLQMAAL